MKKRRQEGSIIFLFYLSFLLHRLPPGKNEKYIYNLFLKPRTQLTGGVEREKE